MANINEDDLHNGNPSVNPGYEGGDADPSRPNWEMDIDVPNMIAGVSGAMPGVATKSSVEENLGLPKDNTVKETMYESNGNIQRTGFLKDMAKWFDEIASSLVGQKPNPTFYEPNQIEQGVGVKKEALTFGNQEIKQPDDFYYNPLHPFDSLDNVEKKGILGDSVNNNISLKDFDDYIDKGLSQIGDLQDLRSQIYFIPKTYSTYDLTNHGDPYYTYKENVNATIQAYLNNYFKYSADTGGMRYSGLSPEMMYGMNTAVPQMSQQSEKSKPKSQLEQLLELLAIIGQFAGSGTISGITKKMLAPKKVNVQPFGSGIELGTALT